MHKKNRFKTIQYTISKCKAFFQTDYDFYTLFTKSVKGVLIDIFVLKIHVWKFITNYIVAYENISMHCKAIF